MITDRNARGDRLFDGLMAELFDKIVKRWATGKSGRRQEQDLKVFQRRARLNRVAVYCLIAFVVVPMSIIALIGRIKTMPSWARTRRDESGTIHGT